MPRYLPEPPLEAEIDGRTLILLVNLGTPDAPTTSALRRYLREFLSDPRVVELPRLLWWPILYGMILPFRAARSARKYASIWREDASPLRAHTEGQAKLLQGLLGARGYSDFIVEHAMRYGSPGLPETLARHHAAGVRRVVLLPLYPQYSASTTGSALDVLCGWMQRTRHQPEIRYCRDFFDHPGYIAALAETVRTNWRNFGQPQEGYRLFMSFHGMPRSSVRKGDPYYQQCRETARLLAAELALPPEQYYVTFQSRFGPSEWLRPYTAPALQAHGRAGTIRADVICPGFVADCLETLEEIAIEGKIAFLRAGGKEFHYIPALNESPSWIATLADLVEPYLHDWVEQRSRNEEFFSEGKTLKIHSIAQDYYSEP
ncbi:MAG: ferrochelatase [Betaproteobacteria bacterium]|nr:ferrochelatase [Betaproteobacteria bacterium]